MPKWNSCDIIACIINNGVILHEMLFMLPLSPHPMHSLVCCVTRLWQRNMCGLSVRFYCIAIFLLPGSFMPFYFILVENRNRNFLHFVYQFYMAEGNYAGFALHTWSTKNCGDLTILLEELPDLIEPVIIVTISSQAILKASYFWERHHAPPREYDMRNNRLTSEAWNVIDINNFEESPRVYCEHMKLQGFRYVWRRKKNFCVNNNLRCKKKITAGDFLKFILFDDDFFFW